MSDENVIDLDAASVTFKIKIKGKEYILREPLVSEVEAIKDNAQSSDAFSFFVKLGMPQEVMNNMGVSQMSALVEGMLNLISKKK